jgi:hypothetical protein
VSTARVRRDFGTSAQNVDGAHRPELGARSLADSERNTRGYRGMHPIPAVPLGLVEGTVCRTEQVGGCGRVLRRGDACTESDCQQGAVADLDRSGGHLATQRVDPGHPIRKRLTREHDNEFLAAVPRQHFIAPNPSDKVAAILRSTSSPAGCPHSSFTRLK